MYCAWVCDLDRVKVKVRGFLNFQKLHFFRSTFSAILACSSKLAVDYDSTGPTACWSPIFEFPFQKTITWLQTLQSVNITQTLKVHISILLEARVIWSGMLVVLYVLCMLTWPWPNPRWRSRSQLLKCRKLHFWHGAQNWWLIMVVSWDLVYSFRSQISEFLPQLVVRWLQSLLNVDNTKIHWVLSPCCLRLEARDCEWI